MLTWTFEVNVLTNALPHVGTLRLITASYHGLGLLKVLGHVQRYLQIKRDARAL